MSEDPILAALARIEAEQARLRRDLSDKLDRPEAVRADIDNTKAPII